MSAREFAVAMKVSDNEQGTGNLGISSVSDIWQI